MQIQGASGLETAHSLMKSIGCNNTLFEIININPNLNIQLIYWSL
jgi:hypothetical protein